MVEIAILSTFGLYKDFPVSHKDWWIVQVSKTPDSSRSILRVFKPAQVICVRDRHITLPLEVGL